MRGVLATVTAAGLVAAAARAPLAHHSFAAEYDAQAPVTVSGVVNRVEWTNPHAYVYVDVKDADGTVVTWAFEGYPPNTLKRIGFPRSLLKAGDAITITGWKARFTPNRAAGREITLPDGKKVFLGPAA
jgi:DNA/RNA endonuclease YhcR with UshA esterase domain